MPAILELVQFEVRQRGLPPFEFLLAERDILEPPEKERWLVRKGRAVTPDRTQPAARADDVTRQRSVCLARGGRRLRVAVMRHDLRRQDAPVADRLRHHLVHE